MIDSERLLKWLLRLVGAACLLAVFALGMPTAWMAATHEWLGLGTFPEGPIVEYLARSVSGFYAFFGGLLLVLSRDPRRHAAVLTYVAAAGLALSVVILVIDVLSALPLWWTVGETVANLSVCTVLLVLLWNVRRVGTSGTPHVG